MRELLYLLAICAWGGGNRFGGKSGRGSQNEMDQGASIQVGIKCDPIEAFEDVIHFVDKLKALQGRTSILTVFWRALIIPGAKLKSDNTGRLPTTK